MKQLWIGLGLLALLLAGGLLLGDLMEEAARMPAEDLEKAADCILEENWDLASALLIRAEKTWRGRKKVAAALNHHEVLDEIDVLFGRLMVFCAYRSRTDFATACAELSRKLADLSQAHRAGWWNLL